MSITSQDLLRASREALVRAQMDAQRNHDIGATLATFSEANYDVVPLGSPNTGAVAVEEFLQGLFEHSPTSHQEARSVHHGDDIVFVDTVIRGTHRGTWAGVPASGNRIEVRCGCTSLRRRTVGERDHVLRPRHPPGPDRAGRLRTERK